MKKAFSALLCILLMLPCTALADSNDAMTLYSSAFASEVSTCGVYVSLTVSGGDLYSGPGTHYVCSALPDMSSQTVHCYSLFRDNGGRTWVLIDFTSNGQSRRGYVPVSSFGRSDQNYLLNALPYEDSYSALTPSMIALPYHNAWGKFGPGDAYPSFLYLEADRIEGTLILSQGEWGLLELNPSSAANYFLSASVRVWVYLPNFMY